MKYYRLLLILYTIPLIGMDYDFYNDTGSFSYQDETPSNDTYQQTPFDTTPAADSATESASNFFLPDEQQATPTTPMENAPIETQAAQETAETAPAGPVTPIIALSFLQYPETQKAVEKKLKKMKKKKKYLYHYNPVAGIFGTYGGFVEPSDNEGVMFFLKKHDKKSITLIITEEASPVVMFEQTVHHWILNKNEKVQAYRYTIVNDTEIDASLWKIEKTSPPSDNIIPLDSIIVFADPDKIIIPTGFIVTHHKGHMVIPPIYVKTGLKYTKNAFYLLNQMHLWGELDQTASHKGNRIIRKVSY